MRQTFTSYEAFGIYRNLLILIMYKIKMDFNM